MSLFNKKSNQPEPIKKPATISVDQSDLRRANQVIQQYMRAVGTTNAEIEAATLAIAIAGGAPSTEQVIISGDDAVEMLARPWLWLVEVGHEAYRQGDQDLVARISCFVWLWVTKICPMLAIGDMAEMRLYKPPQATLAELYNIAIRTLLFMDMDKVVASNQTGTVHVKDLLLGCAMEARNLKSYLEPDVISTVNSIEKKFLS